MTHFKNEKIQVRNWHHKNHEHMKFQTSYKQLTKYNQFNQSTLLKMHLNHFCNGKQ